MKGFFVVLVLSALIQQSGHSQQSDNTQQVYDFQPIHNLQSRVQPFQPQTFRSIPFSASSQYPSQTQHAPYSSATASSSDHYVRSVCPRLAQSSPPPWQFLGTSFCRPQHSLHEPAEGFHSAASSHPGSWSLSVQIPYPSSCRGPGFGTPGTTASSASRSHSQSRTDRRLSSHHEALWHAELQVQLREYQFAASARAKSDQSLHSARCDALSDQSSRGDGLALQLAYAKSDNAAVRQCRSICRNPSPSRSYRRAQNNHPSNTSKASPSRFGSLAT